MKAEEAEEGMKVVVKVVKVVVVAMNISLSTHSLINDK